MSTIISKHTQAAPATAYALSVLRTDERITEPETRTLLLTVAALADEALYSGDGYNGHYDHEVAELLALDDKTDALAELVYLRHLGVLTNSFDRFRIPQVAYDRANGDV
jgi:hypothetical protein